MKRHGKVFGNHEIEPECMQGKASYEDYTWQDPIVGAVYDGEDVADALVYLEQDFTMDVVATLKAVGVPQQVINLVLDSFNTSMQETFPQLMQELEECEYK